jgi:hypothetical protein
LERNHARHIREVGRRALIKSAAFVAVAAKAGAQGQAPAADVVTTLADVPLSAANTVTVERRATSCSSA